MNYIIYNINNSLSVTWGPRSEFFFLQLILNLKVKNKSSINEKKKSKYIKLKYF